MDGNKKPENSLLEAAHRLKYHKNDTHLFLYLSTQRILALAFPSLRKVVQEHIWCSITSPRQAFRCLVNTATCYLISGLHIHQGN